MKCTPNSRTKFVYNMFHHISATMTSVKALYDRDPPQFICTKGSSQYPTDVQM